MKDLPDFPRYKSHREVAAFKIAAYFTGGAVPVGSMRFVSEHGEEATVDQIWANKHVPDNSLHPSGFIGGYFVAYPDGYTSWSPGESFEAGYTLIE